MLPKNQYFRLSSFLIALTGIIHILLQVLANELHLYASKSQEMTLDIINNNTVAYLVRT